MPGSSASNTLDLKNPYFRYTGQPIQPPPGCNTTSPSEDYWQQLDSTVGTAMNGNMMINGNNSNINGINMVQHQVSPVAQQIQLDPNQFTAQPIQHLNNTVLNTANINQSACNNRVTQLQPNNLSMGGGGGGATAGNGSPYMLMGQNVVPSASVGNSIGNLFNSGPGSSTNVAGININFPVNQSLMIGDYAAAVDVLRLSVALR